MTEGTRRARAQASTADTAGTGGGLAVEIRDLDVTFSIDGGDVHAVRDVSLDVRPGEVLAIVGESGSGKTVTARSILGLLPETATTRGAVILDGTEVVGLSGERLREIRGTKAAMIFQEPSTALNPVFTVGWQLAEGLRAHGAYSKKQARAKAIEMLERVGIPEPARRVDDYPHQFSGGQKQRIVIAMALALDPSVLLADEPTTALDVTTQAEIMAILRRLRDERGLTVLLVTHDLELAAAVCDRISVMYAGTIVEQQPAAALFADPRHPYTAGLLASSPRRVAAGERLAAIPGRPLGLHEAPEGCVFRGRCAHARDVCATRRPPLEPAGEGVSACLRQHELGTLLPASAKAEEVSHGIGR